MPCCARRNSDDSKWMATDFFSVADGVADHQAPGRVRGARVQPGADLAGPCDEAGGANSLSANRRGRKPRNELEGVRAGPALVQWCFHDPALRAAASAAVGVAAVESAESGGRASSACGQKPTFVYDPNQNAEIRPRHPHELFPSYRRSRGSPIWVSWPGG